MTKPAPAKQRSTSASPSAANSVEQDANAPRSPGGDIEPNRSTLHAAADYVDPRAHPTAATSSAAGDRASSDEQHVHQMDPRTILPSRWANRHPGSFASKDFEDLKSSIRDAGINVQAIKVRPLAESGAEDQSGNDSDHPPPQFEIVFGHRRHRACLELGLPVAAILLTMSDKELFAEMDRENRAHKALSPYEQGAMFKQALDSGLYPSARSLAHGLGIDISLVSKALTIAQLPTEVLYAFASPLDIQYRWASALNAAHRENPQALTARASVLCETSEKRGASQVFRTLAGLDRISERVRISGREGQAQIESDEKGRLAIYIRTPLTEGQRGKLESALREILDVR